MEFTVALAGNPNSGKTTIFNYLTGARQHVGNYPGVTVEKKEGVCRFEGNVVNVVDLPGTYCLTAFSVEEVVARQFITEEKPDVVVNVVDATNLERNLYLSVQLIELGVPLVVAFNMSDVAERKGVKFDLEKLSALFGAPFVETVGSTGRGLDEVLRQACRVAASKESKPPVHVDYGEEIEQELCALCKLLKPACPREKRRWVALKLLENDSLVIKKYASGEIEKELASASGRIEALRGDKPEILIADYRYGFISGACTESVVFSVEERHSMSDRIDMVLMNRFFGIPLFLLFMYFVFTFTFKFGEAPMGWIESAFGVLSDFIAGLWPAGAQSPLKSLIVDGIIGGVGGVVVFLPNIMLLFLCIAFMEDSGYMARAAFLMDRFMHKIGLHGKSFIPMLTGFGCSVPAIMATRTLENEKDRLTTMLVVPLMSCGARLPIYALFIPAFFAPSLRAPVLFAIYLLGIVLAVLVAKLLKSTLFKGEATPFVMELPPYRMPTFKGLCIHTGYKGWMYLKKAGTVILGFSVLLWVAAAYPQKSSFDHDYKAMRQNAVSEFTRGVEKVAGMSGIENVTALKQALVAQAAKATGTQLDVDGVGFDRTFSIPVGDFLHFMKNVQSLRTHVIPEEPKTAYEALIHQKKAALILLEKTSPQMFSSSVYFADQVLEPFVERMDAIRQQKQSEIMSYTIAGRIGHGLEPFLKPLGFDWKIGTALIGALAAKEMFVAQIGIVYAVDDAEGGADVLRDKLAKNYSPLVGLCIMLFCLISAPCVATIAVTCRESGSWRWGLLQLGGLTVLAYMVTFVVYQVGMLFQFGV